MTELVHCEGVGRTFGRDSRAVVALHEVSCVVPQGARIAISGPSGSGKSTLLQLMAGLDEPTAGSLSWPGLGGHPATDPGLVGIVFQGPSLMPALSAVENVAFPLVLRGVTGKEARALALENMHRLGIDTVANQLPDELSGGQSQRVAVARVLTMRPRLILADEPTGRLDHQAGDHVVDVLLQTADELGSALVTTTHDPRIADRFDTRWRMRDGALDQPEHVLEGRHA